MGRRGIFICYRREDSRWPARALAQELRVRFGNENVFMDVDTARIGNWRARIDESLEASAVVLVLIGPQWLDEFEKRTDGRDEVRYEIAEAIQRGLILLPVTLGITQLPARRLLPEDVAPLTDEEAYQLGEDKYWRPTLTVLIEDLEQALRSDHAAEGEGETGSDVESLVAGNRPGDSRTDPHEEVRARETIGHLDDSAPTIRTRTGAADAARHAPRGTTRRTDESSDAGTRDANISKSIRPTPKGKRTRPRAARTTEQAAMPPASAPPIPTPPIAPVITQREELKAMARQNQDRLIKCPICNASVKGKNLVRHYDTNHGASAPSGTEPHDVIASKSGLAKPTKALPRVMTQREELKVMARQNQEGLIKCPICNAGVKGKNLVRHYDTNHASATL